MNDKAVALRKDESRDHGLQKMSFMFGHVVADEQDLGFRKDFDEEDHRQVLRGPVHDPPRKNRERRPVPDNVFGRFQPGQRIERIQEGLRFLFSQIESALFPIGFAREKESGILPSEAIEMGLVLCF
jgi:hypothetical protein